MAHGTPTVVASGGTNDSSGAATSGSFTPSQGDCLIASVHGYGSSPPAPTISDSLGRTWALLASAMADSSSDNRGALYSHIVTEASPAARTVSAACAGATLAAVYVLAVSGAQPRYVAGSPNAAGADDPTNGDPSGTLPNAVLSTSTLVQIGISVGSGFNWTNSFTSLHTYDNPGTTFHRSGYKTSPASTGFGFTANNGAHVALCVEIEDYVDPGQPYVKRLGGVPFMAPNLGVW